MTTASTDAEHSALDADPPSARFVATTTGFVVDVAAATANGHANRHGAWRARLPKILLAGDALAAAIAVALAWQIRSSQRPAAVLAGHRSLSFAAVGVSLVAFWLMSVAIAGGYHRKLLGAGGDEYRVVITAGALFLAVIAVWLFVFGISARRSFVASAVPLTVAFTIALRYTARQVLHRGRQQGKYMQRVALYGTASSADAIARHIAANSWAGLDVVGACLVGPRSSACELADLGDREDLLRAIREHRIDTVAVTSEIPHGELRSLAWSLRGSGVELLVAPSITDIAGPRITIRPLGGLPLLSVDEPELDWFGRIAKGVFDKAGAALILTLAAPFMAMIAVAIKATSKGPVFYRQVRIGRNGLPFTFLKFRTMVAGADAQLDELRHHNEADGPLFKLRNDPRITPVGRLLRRFSIDELPQVWHVLTGKMSLVGPRPPLPSEVQEYDPTVRRRLLVKPGMTGLWQVSGRSDLSWQEAVRLDLFYIDHWSISMDVTILLKTITAVLRGRGAY